MIDMNKIEEIYGKTTIYRFKENIEKITNNIELLREKSFENIEELIELNPYLLILPEDIFKEKIDNIICKLGINYNEIINENTSIWSNIEC